MREERGGRGREREGGREGGTYESKEESARNWNLML